MCAFGGRAAVLGEQFAFAVVKTLTDQPIPSGLSSIRVLFGATFEEILQLFSF